MPITIQWDEHIEHALYINFTGIWTWAEFEEVGLQERDLTKNQNHYDVLADVRDSVLPRGDLFSTPIANFKAKPPNWGVTVIIANHYLFTVVLRGVMRITPGTKRRYFVTDTLEEAREILHEKAISSH